MEIVPKACYENFIFRVFTTFNQSICVYMYMWMFACIQGRDEGCVHNGCVSTLQSISTIFSKSIQISNCLFEGFLVFCFVKFNETIYFVVQCFHVEQ